VSAAMSDDDGIRVGSASVASFAHPNPPTYEERITLWQASSLDHAIEQAEAEALAYSGLVASEYLRIAQAYWIGTEQPSRGSESSRSCVRATSTPTTTSTASSTPATSASGCPSRSHSSVSGPRR